jgi:hypothetical protein
VCRLRVQNQAKRLHGSGPPQETSTRSLELAHRLPVCSIPKIQILEFSQTSSKFKMNFKFHFKMFVCELISTNKIIVVYILFKISSKYPTNISPVITLKLFQKYCPNIPPIYLQVFFFLRNTFRIIFQVPTNISS